VRYFAHIAGDFVAPGAKAKSFEVGPMVLSHLDRPADAEWPHRLDELHQASRWQDQVEAMHYVDCDQAAADAGLPVG
jgi:hypothetical protein